MIFFLIINCNPCLYEWTICKYCYVSGMQEVQDLEECLNGVEWKNLGKLIGNLR
jgi:mannose/fructose/N-acetylgalactosamine-specific phosphotransferase system component IID